MFHCIIIIQGNTKKKKKTDSSLIPELLLKTDLTDLIEFGQNRFRLWQKKNRSDKIVY